MIVLCGLLMVAVLAAILFVVVLSSVRAEVEKFEDNTRKQLMARRVKAIGPGEGGI